MPGFPSLIDLATLGSDGIKIQGDAEDDQAGGSVSNAGDVNGDGLDDIIIGARNNDSGGNSAGAAYVIFGKASGFAAIDLTSLTTADGFKIQGDAALDYAGRSVSSAGDVNGDGFADVIVGAQGHGGDLEGAAYVIFGKASDFATIDLATLAAADGFKIQGTGGDYAGYSVSSAGDVNGDGFDDMVVGALQGLYFGKAYVIFGKAAAFTEIDLTSLAAADGFRIQGEARGDRVGSSVSSAGDINGDGFDDIIVGAVGNDSGGYSNAGAAYVVFGKASGFGPINLSSLAAADGFKIQGDAPGDVAGAKVSSAGDINGDGFDDIVVSGHGNDSGGNSAGAAYVLFGKASGFSSIDLASLAAAEGFKIQGNGDLDQAGWGLSSAGDVNGDGFDDIIVGALGNDSGGTNAGAAYVIFGKTGGFGTIDLASLAAADGVKIQGDADGDNAGYSVSSAGDVDDDGFDDILVGAHENDSGGLNAGAAYLIFGRGDPNLAPSGADSTKTIFEDHAYIFAATDFGFSDVDGDDPAAVRIATLPGAGILRFDADGAGASVAVPVTAGQVISFADIEAGRLSFVPASNASGPGYASFTFQVKDDGKTGYGGADLDPTPNSFTFNVTEIYDPTGFPSVINVFNLGALGFIVRGQGAWDLYDTTASSAGDINRDGIEDFALSSYVIFGNASGFTALDLGALTPTVGFMAHAEGYDGVSGISAGDFNGDGFDDIIVAASRNDSGGYNAGAVYVVFGKAGGVAAIDLEELPASEGFKILGEAAGDYLGHSLAVAGDVNGDGFDDLILGSRYQDGGGSDAGAAYVIFGKASQLTTIDLASLTPAEGFRILGEVDDDHAGDSVSSAGDVNGDGFDDIIVGAHGNTGAGPDSGAAYLVFGKSSGFTTVDLGAMPPAQGFKIEGGGYAGFSVSSAGDVNGDGLADMLIGAPHNSSQFGHAGAAYVVFGKASGLTSVNLTSLTSTEGFKILGHAPFDRAGFSVSSAGDVNGDGFDDIIVGARNDDIGVTDAGAAYVIFGKASGFATIGLADLGPADGFRIQSDDFFEQIGATVASLGDINGDGFADILAATYGTREDIRSYAYVVFGAAPTTSVTRIGSTADQIIRGGIYNDYIDGLGGADSLFGGEGDDELIGDADDDTLDGGTGADAMTGGAGKDIYVVDNAGDVVTENAGQGTDEIRTGLLSYSIAALANIENLTGLGSAGQTLTGNDADNLIDGGLGADAMTAGIGNDTYVVDNAGDVVTENSGEGTDTVRTALGIVSSNAAALYYLPDNVEDFVAAGNAQGVWGNTLDNVITSTGGADLVVLADRVFPYAGANQGSDTVDAGGGNDYLFFAGSFDALDGVDGGSGADVVALLGNYPSLVLGAASLVGVERLAMYSSGNAADPYSYTVTTHDANVAAGQALFIGAGSLQAGERLAFNGAAETNGAFTVFAGDDSDILIGGARADRLIGRGGADQLTGGLGNDVFQYNAITESNAVSRDTILDFTFGDRIDLWYVDARSATGANEAFSFIGQAAFTGAGAASAGQLRFQNVSGATWAVQGDTDGNGIADFMLHVTVTDADPITAGDFIL